MHKQHHKEARLRSLEAAGRVEKALIDELGTDDPDRILAYLRKEASKEQEQEREDQKILFTLARLLDGCD